MASLCTSEKHSAIDLQQSFGTRAEDDFYPEIVVGSFHFTRGFAAEHCAPACLTAEHPNRCDIPDRSCVRVRNFDDFVLCISAASSAKFVWISGVHSVNIRKGHVNLQVNVGGVPVLVN